MQKLKLGKKTLLDISNNNLKMYQVIGIYTAIFVVMFLAVYSSFIIFGKSLVWYADGMSQHYPVLRYIGIWGREIIRNFLHGNFTIPTFDFGVGYGTSIITSFHYYGITDPLCWTSILVPADYTEYLYGFLTIARYYIAGLGFLLYCKTMKQDLRVAVMSSFIYIFCAFSLHGVTNHPFFISGMVYFPYILIGTEKIFKKQNPLVFILSVALMILTNFYFSYTAIIMTAVYVIIRFVYLKHTKFLKELFFTILRFACFGALAIMVAGVIFLPVLSVFFGSNRAEISKPVPILYDYKYYESLINSYMGVSGIGYWNIAGYTPIALISVFFIFIKKGKYKPLKTAVIVSYILQLFPIFGSMLNGFDYVSNRWIWANAFLMAFIVTCTFKDIIKASLTDKRKILIISGIYLLVFILIRSSKNISTLTQLALLTTIIICLIATELLFRENLKKRCAYAIAFITAFAISFNGIFCYSPAYNNAVSQFENLGQVTEKFDYNESNNLNHHLKNTKSSFYRYESADIRSTHLNQSIFNNTSGLSFFFSLSSENTVPFFYEMELPIITSSMYENINSRSFIGALTSTKHYITTNINDNAPYGYKKVGQRDSWILYKNQNALPIGYTYDSYITRDEYDNLSSVEKQEVLLQSVLLEKDADNIKKGTPTTISKKLAYEAVYGDTVIKVDGGVYVTAPNSTATLKFKGEKNSETYVKLNNIQAKYLDDYEMSKALPKTDEQEPVSYSTKATNLYGHIYKGAGKTVFDLIFTPNKGAPTTVKLAAPEYQFYAGLHDFTINLGYADNQPLTYCTITFPSEGFYSWDDIEIISQPMDNYDTYVDALKEDTLKSLNIGDDQIKGKITLNEDKILCLSIPYSKGWTAYVDGKETELLQANTWSMALNLTAGEHTIVLNYTTPFLKLGLALSIIGMILTVAVTAFYVVKRKNI